ncbi:MAG: SCO family protein [Bacteroidota bacterium]
MRMLLFICLLAVVACTPAGPPNSVHRTKAESFHRHHPMDESQNFFLLDTLGFLGQFEVDTDGKPVPRPVRDWTYVTQLGDTVSNNSLAGKVYVADFFFTSCPSICPKVKSEMMRIYERFAGEDNFRMVSFTLDPKRDTPAVMKTYAENLGVTDHNRWWFLYGDRFKTYELDADYLSIGEENPDAPGGFDHTPYVILVDQNGFVRSYGSGLEAAEIDHLMENITLLLEG